MKIGEYRLVIEFHGGGSAPNGATMSSLKASVDLYEIRVATAEVVDRRRWRR